jgi:hypothetical protein
MKEKYNKEQCVFGPDSKAICKFCSVCVRKDTKILKKRGIVVEIS